MAVYFFYGDEDYKIELELNNMSSELDHDFKSLNFKSFDNPDYETLINCLRTPPMMFGKMLTIINIEDYLYSKKKTFDDNELHEIEEALDNNQALSDIVFVVKIPRDDGKKLDSRKKLYKILTKYNTKEFFVYKTYQVNEISTWINKRAKIKGITLDKDATDTLIEQIGNNLRDFDMELDKLILAAYPDKKITKKMIENNCLSNQDLFNFTELIMNNRKDKALMEFKKLLDKKHPLELLAAIQTMLRKWIVLKTKSSLSALELSKITGLPEFVVKQNLLKLKNTKAADLVNLKSNLFDVEYKIKSAEAIDIISEVESAIIR